MPENSYKWFSNKECKYYPCHKDGETNCLFCFCPLYNFENCGGNFVINKRGLKDCKDCKIPHSEGGYEYIINKIIENKKD